MSHKNQFSAEYPHLKKVVLSERYGRMELLSVSKTSDGFLMGWVRIGTGKAAYEHSAVLGRCPPDIMARGTFAEC
jgi:hypothetical protein